MKIRKLRILFAVLMIGAVSLSGFAQYTRADHSVSNDTYELRVYFDFNYFTGREPQIETKVKVETLFFAKSEIKSSDISEKHKDENSPSPLYVVSGMLHQSKDGSFTLESNLLLWWSPASNFTYTSDGIQLELDKPQSEFSSDGIVHGYTIILSKK